jgi:hypothetical protein
MTEPKPAPTSHALPDDPRPWAFTQAELTAGLRRFTGDPSLKITELTGRDVTQRRPAIGRLRGLAVKAEGRVTGKHTFTLVLKEPHGVTRKGTAGAGYREVALYQLLADYLPVRVPQLFAAHPNGDWLVLEMLPPGRTPEYWRKDDYLLAADQLVALHDRFWGLGADLTAYNWLARPLDADLNIHMQAAVSGHQRLVQGSASSLLTDDPDLSRALDTLLSRIEVLVQPLRSLPATLLHGDFWSGNIHVHPNGSLTVYDWQHTGIGPGILDLVTFIQSSLWWFSPLPLTPAEIVAHYRRALRQANGARWTNKEWNHLWDHALLWQFLTRWLDVLASMPEPILQSHQSLLAATWLKPVRQAASRVLG